MMHFGFSMATWTKAVRRGAVKARRVAFTVDEALTKSKCRLTVKRHLLRAGILKNRCDWCGLTSWRGRPISIQIDHINGVRDDHRVENLRMLCRNCHSETDTFAAKNINRMVFPVRLTVGLQVLILPMVVRVHHRELITALSSSGLGRRPLTAVTRVRLPLGLPLKTLTL
jgi:hypothetical protein